MGGTENAGRDGTAARSIGVTAAIADSSGDGGSDTRDGEDPDLGAMTGDSETGNVHGNRMGWSRGGGSIRGHGESPDLGDMAADVEMGNVDGERFRWSPQEDSMSRPRSLPEDESITSSEQDSSPAGRGWDMLSSEPPGISGLLRRLNAARETIEQQADEKVAIISLVQMLRVLLHWRTAAAASVHSSSKGQSLAAQRARHTAARALQVPKSRTQPLA